MAGKEFVIENIENVNRFNESGILSKSKLKHALDQVVAQVEANMSVFGEKFPSPATRDQQYVVGENQEWTPGFWTGMLWLAYEYTGQVKFKELAIKNVISFNDRIDNNIDVDNHDLGFMYLPSCVNAYHLTGDKVAKQAAIKAADKLMTRFQPKGNFIQAWGKKGANDNYRLIIDALLNILLAFTATVSTNALRDFVNAIPQWLIQGFSVAGELLPAVGFALIMSTMLKKEYLPAIILGYVGVAYLKMPVIGLTFLGIILALNNYYQKRKNNNNHNDNDGTTVEDGGAEDGI